jgi:phage tail sheath protein FI
MPSSLTFPGVYIEEIPSGVRTITGVSTSNTAFVDNFARGPVNKATQINSLADFQRIFGGLDKNSPASYAIQQYYLNGGQVAWLVRVTAGNPQTATIILQGSSPLQINLIVDAINPGAWGNNLEVALTQPPAPATPGQFNLFVR